MIYDEFIEIQGWILIMHLCMRLSHL